MTVQEKVRELPAERLEADIVGLARHLSAGTYELLVLVGELDTRGRWAASGALTCAVWLADACDIEPSTARTQVRVARAMRTHPALDVAMASGDVSYGKARTLVPHLSPDNAAALVGLASRTPAQQLGPAIAAWMLGHDNPADIDTRQHHERSVSWRTDPDGMTVITIRVPPMVGGGICAVIDHRVRAQHAPMGASLRQQRADAVAALLTTNPGAGGGVTAEMVIHIRGNEPARLADGTPLSDHAVTALLPDAFVSLLLHDTDRHPIDASPRRRHPTRRQRRVNDDAHPTCAWPGCRATTFLQHDHIHPYEQGGPTTIANLQRLCGPHNRAKEQAAARR